MDRNAYALDPGNSPAASCDSRATDVRLSLHDDLAVLEREWRGFEQRADCTVFQSFGWLSAWQLHIGAPSGARPAIVIGRDAQGDILFLLPLSVEHRLFMRRLTWPGSEMSDYNAPLLAPDFSQKLGTHRYLSLWPEILGRIQRHPGLRFDLIHLVRMPERVGTQENPLRHLPVTIHPSGAYLAHLAGDWETFYATKRSAATRRRDRRKRKHLSEMGEVKLVAPQAVEEIAGSLDTLIAQKTRSFGAMGVGNLFDKPGYSDFFRSLAMDPATRPIVHVSRLDVGTTAAAVNFGLRFRGSHYHVLSSYADNELSRFGPGEAHLHELMRDAIDAGCKVFDFTVGDEPYKRDWSDTQSVLFDHVAAAGWRGAWAAPALLAQTRIKRFIKQTPAVWKAISKARAFFGTLRRWMAKVRA